MSKVIHTTVIRSVIWAEKITAVYQGEDPLHPAEIKVLRSHETRFTCSEIDTARAMIGAALREITAEARTL